MQDNNRAMPPHPVDSTKAASLSEQALNAARDVKHDAAGSVDDRLPATAGEIAGAAKGWLEEMKARVRDNPITSVALVAALGYVWGATR